MTTSRCCPLCDKPRIDEGESTAPEYRAGLWIGCTACGLSVSGPRPAAVRIAWAAVVRSTKLRAIADIAGELAK